MWMKILGSVLVTVSCSGLGLWKAGQWKEHRKLLEQIRKMILLLKGEILYAHAPLGEALEHVGRKSEGVPAKLFCRVAERIGQQDGELFYDLWKEAIDSHRKELLLTEKECEEFKALGEHLGYLDLGMQERTIELYLEQLELSLDFYREHERERVKLCTSLGVMGGLFLSIIMC